MIPSSSRSRIRNTAATERGARMPGFRACGGGHQTYVYWIVRFTRFCLECLKQTPQDAGTPALTAYLNYLALERNVSDSTQNQALNAMVFLTKKVFGVEEFTIDKPAHGHTNGVAIRLCLRNPLPASPHRTGRPPSPARGLHAAPVQERRPQDRYRLTRHLPLSAPLVRVVSPPKRHRHPNRPGSPRPCRRFHHHDLSARHQTPGGGRP